MRFEPGYLFGMALQTIPEPRKVAREVLSLPYPRAALWQVLLLLLVASTGLGVLTGMVFPPDPALEGTLAGDPVLLGLGEGSVSVLIVFVIYWLGRALGGTGRFEQAILTVIWMHFVLLIVQLGVVVLSLFAPALALLLWVMGGVTGFWILSHFIAEMHGFRSAGVVFAGIFLVLMVAVVAISVVLTLIGLGAGTGAI